MASPTIFYLPHGACSSQAGPASPAFAMLTALLLGPAYVLSPMRPSGTSSRCRIVAAEATCDVMVVGAGVPKRGMSLTGFVALGRGKASRQNLGLHCRNLMTLIDGATAIQKQNPVLLMGWYHAKQILDGDTPGLRNRLTRRPTQRRWVRRLRSVTLCRTTCGACPLRTWGVAPATPRTLHTVHPSLLCTATGSSLSPVFFFVTTV